MPKEICNCGKPAEYYDSAGGWFCQDCVQLLLFPDLNTVQLNKESVAKMLRTASAQRGDIPILEKDEPKPQPPNTQ